MASVVATDPASAIDTTQRMTLRNLCAPKRCRGHDHITPPDYFEEWTPSYSHDSPKRKEPLAGPLRALLGHADDRSRHDRRERRAAPDPGRPRLLGLEPRLGDQRLPDR